jgi:biotin carboxylase
MPRVLLFATTTGYQTHSFGSAAERLGVELAFATDRCDRLDDPWQDGAIAIRFHEEDRSVAAIVEASRTRPIDGVLVVGDRPTAIAARVAKALDLPWHPPYGAEAAKNKVLARERFRGVGLSTPWFLPLALSPDRIGSLDAPALGPGMRFPCVVKPLSLSASRGVMRADDDASLSAAVARLRGLMASPDLRAERNSAHEYGLIEEFIPGREYAVEAVMHHGDVKVLAIFDKPDPLDGPFFEETIYVTPSRASEAEQRAITETVGRGAVALGLYHGPIHAECRVRPAGLSSVRESPEQTAARVCLLEVAARPIGGLCAQALRFVSDGEAEPASLEEMLLRHALGASPICWRREPQASGVMMIPIPRRGTYRSVEGVDAAGAVPHVSNIQITAKTDQLLVPLPEGASYLGFIFARAPEPADVEQALRAAHAQLRFRIDAELPVLGAG